uniref:hypothetical protein n=1 Tax=Pelagibius sp. TaxID=1931238 RepID=UPI00260EAE07
MHGPQSLIRNDALSVEGLSPSAHPKSSLPDLFRQSIEVRDSVFPWTLGTSPLLSGLGISEFQGQLGIAWRMVVLGFEQSVDAF